MSQVRTLEAALAAQQAAWRREALRHVWLRERALVLQLVRVQAYKDLRLLHRYLRQEMSKVWHKECMAYL
jgi:hypothetical protein